MCLSLPPCGPCLGPRALYPSPASPLSPLLVSALALCHASSEPSGERPAPRHGLSVPDSWGTLPSGTLCSSYSVSPTLPPPSIAPHLASLCTVSLVSSPSRTIPPPPGSPPGLSGWVRCALGSLFLTPLGPHLRRGWACPPTVLRGCCGHRHVPSTTLPRVGHSAGAQRMFVEPDTRYR